MLVAVEDRHAVDVLDRHDGFREAALVPRRRRALLALDRVGVDVGAAEAVLGRDQIGGDALRHEVAGQRHLRIDRPGVAGRADADAAHGFDAAGDDHVVLAGGDRGVGEVDRVEAGGAVAVDLHARHGVREAGGEDGVAGDVAARLADRIDAAEDHVVDDRRVEVVAVADRGQRAGGEHRGRDFVQGAILLAAAARRADVIVDEGFGHGCFSSERFFRQRHQRIGAGGDAREAQRGLGHRALHEGAAEQQVGFQHLGVCVAGGDRSCDATAIRAHM